MAANPISLFTSIAGALRATGQITTQTTDLIERERDVPDICLSLLSRVQDVELYLGQLYPLLQDLDRTSSRGREVISLDSLIVVSTSCVVTLSDLERMLDALRPDQPLTTDARTHWAREQSSISSLLSRLDHLSKAIKSMLVILGCTTVTDLHSYVDSLNAAINTILHDSAETTQRVANLDLALETASRSSASTLVAGDDISDRQSLLTLRERQDPETASLVTSNTDEPLAFDQTLLSQIFASRVYLRSNTRSISDSHSIRSHAGFSVLSTFSLSQVSHLSVVSLPIFMNEVWNPTHYESGVNSGSPVNAGRSWMNGVFRPRYFRDIHQQNLRQGRSSHYDIMPFLQGLRNNVRAEYKNAEHTILLLGPGAAGKTTIRNQMLLLNKQPFSDYERKGYLSIIRANIFEALCALILWVGDTGSAYCSPDTESCSFSILEAHSLFRADPEDPSLFEYVHVIETFVSDDVIRTAVAAGWHDSANENFSYYLRNLRRIFAGDYLPTDQDILHHYTRTTGISDISVHQGDTIFHIRDVGGHRPERKKWKHAFSEVDCLIFVVPLGDLGKVLMEDHSEPRIADSEMLFESILQVQDAHGRSHCFDDLPVFVFLNKTDLLTEELQEGTSRDARSKIKEKTITQYAQIYRQIARLRNPNQLIHIHHTNATNTEELRMIFSDVFREAALSHSKNKR